MNATGETGESLSDTEQASARMPWGKIYTEKEGCTHIGPIPYVIVS